MPVAQADGGDCQAQPAVDLKTAARCTGLLARMAEIKTLAGLDGASTGDIKITIFAPTDEAFATLPDWIRTGLLKPENRILLADLLLHHAVIGEFSTERLLKARAKHYGVEAVDGTEIEFTVRAGLDIHGARLVKGDIVASNGILHVIDKVLIPRQVMKALEEQRVQPDAQQTAAVD